MANLILIAAIIGAAAIILILAPRIKRWIRGRMLKEKDEAIPLFNCSIASKGNESGTSNSGDIYDCVETKGEETEPKTEEVN
jgi:gas vesicle protein